MSDPEIPLAEVVWTEAALFDLQSIRRYVGEFNPNAAAHLAERLVAAGDGLAIFPRRGRPAGDGLRELSIVYPYIIRYEIVEERVVILRVRHGRIRR